MPPDQLPDHLATHQGKLLVVPRNRYRAEARPVQHISGMAIKVSRSDHLVGENPI
jgi:hypothetical protein